MNCRPGDIARIVYPSIHRDKIVRLTVLDALSPAGRPAWHYEAPLLPCLDWPETHDMVSIYDDHLRPIRDPGDDARDQFARPAESLLRPKRQVEFT